MYELLIFERFVIYGSLMMVSYINGLRENRKCEPRESLQMFAEDLGELNSKEACFPTHAL